MEQPGSQGRVAVDSGSVRDRASLVAGRFEGAARYSFSPLSWLRKTVFLAVRVLSVPVHLALGCRFRGVEDRIRLGL